MDPVMRELLVTIRAGIVNPTDRWRVHYFLGELLAGAISLAEANRLLAAELVDAKRSGAGNSACHPTQLKTDGAR
jgi:hypothetical protein